MSLWLAIGAMTLLAMALLAVPLLRRPRRGAPRAAHDLEIYRDQLAEIDRDVGRGLLTDDQAEAAKAEIGRRMLAARDAADAAPSERRAPSRPAAAVVAVAVPAIAVLLYLDGGAPDLPGRPAADDAAQRAAAEAQAKRSEAMVAELARRMKENPGDARGWELLAHALIQLDRYDEGVEAYRRAVALRPGNADLLSRYGEAVTLAADGTVSPKARETFDAALAADPGEPRARFYLGVAAMQAGRNREALDRWLALEADSPPNAPWLALLSERIERLASRLKVDLGAARRTRADESKGRAEMIRSMVARLAARLEEEPGDVEGWLRLGRSYRVLGKPAESRDAYARAAKLRPDDPAVLGRYASSILLAAGTEGKVPASFASVVADILRIDPDNQDGLWLAGLGAARAGDRETAESRWRRLLALLEPGSPQHAQLERRIEALKKTK